ncbi:MAG TPA: signal peptidase I, partial [Propionibacteriaceae bacterium]|nr:signal peptidase I [Propionibacteriaceae bacterium]
MSTKTRTNLKPLASLGRWSLRTVSALIVLGMVAALNVLIVLPRATQGAALTVLTGSMTPQIPVGSVVLVRPVDSRTLQVGDIATYQTEPGKEEFITHRIVDIDTSTEPTSFTFKGDANKGPDIDPVPAGAIRGEVWFHVPFLGAIRDALHGKAGLGLITMILLGGYALAQAFGAAKDRRESKKSVGIDESSDLEVIICDGPLVVATFRTMDVASAPCVLARSWSALLLSEDDQSFSVLLAQRPDNPMKQAHFLESFHPTSITAIDSSVLL